MFIFRGRSISIMVLYAIALHFLWSIILLFDQSALNVTAVDALFDVTKWLSLPVAAVSVVTGVAAFLAMAALCSRWSWTVWLLLPQQILLMISASGAIEAVWISQFSDGVIRSRGFIAADQMHIVLAAIGHTAAIIVHAMRLVR
jgi:hypothetical protein